MQKPLLCELGRECNFPDEYTAHIFFTKKVTNCDDDDDSTRHIYVCKQPLYDTHDKGEWRNA